MTHNYKFLDKINFPSDLRKISENDLQKVSDELRKEIFAFRTLLLDRMP